MRLPLLLMLVFAASTGYSNEPRPLPKVLHLAAPHWCPFSCDPDVAGGHSGILVDYLGQILQQHGMQLKVSILPWSRAIRATQQGLYDGLVSAVPAEAPTLLFTTTATTSYTNCFFTTAEHQYWKYYDPHSLQEIRLAYLKDYGYEAPIAAHINDPANKRRVVEVSGDRGVERMIRLLDIGRVDAFIEERWVAQWEFNQSRFINQKDLQQASCMDGNPFYIALRPNLASADKLLAIFNRELAVDSNKALLARIARQYLQPTE